MCYKLGQHAGTVAKTAPKTAAKTKPVKGKVAAGKTCSICNRVPEDGEFYARTRHCLPCAKQYAAEQYQKRKMAQQKG